MTLGAFRTAAAALCGLSWVPLRHARGRQQAGGRRERQPTSASLHSPTAMALLLTALDAQRAALGHSMRSRQLRHHPPTGRRRS